MSAIKPLDATAKYCGQWYKFGKLGRLFVWRDDDWLISTIDKQLIRDEIIKVEVILAKRRNTKSVCTSNQLEIDKIMP